MYDNIPDYDNLHSDSDEEVQYDDRNRESQLRNYLFLVWVLNRMNRISDFSVLESNTPPPSKGVCFV